MTAARAWRAAALLSVFLVFVTGPARANNCEVTFGDDLFEWVDRDARRQSLALAEADFDSRANNSRVIEYGALTKVATELAAALNLVTAAQADGETRRMRMEEAAAALDLQRESTAMLDKLLASGDQVALLRQRLAALAQAPSRQSFRAFGGPQIGRTTMLATFPGIVTNAEETLFARYSVYVSVTFNSDGVAQNGSADLGGNEYVAAGDGVAAELIASGEPYAVMIGSAWYGIRALVFVGETAECEERIAQQKERARAAMTRLPTLLPSEDELYALHERLDTEAIARFAEMQSVFTANAEAIERRWRNLLALTLARQHVAAKTLTVSKVDRLRRAYDRGDPLGRIFDQVALTRMTKEIRELQRVVLQEEIDIAGACRNLTGALAAETLLDRRREAVAQLEALVVAKSLAPLQDTMNRVASRLRQPVPRAVRLSQATGDLPCTEAWRSRQAMLRTTAPQKVALKSAAIATLQSNLPAATAIDAHWAPPLCIIYRSGRSYHCGQPPAGDPGLAGEFPGGPNSSYRRVREGANDGGFAKDVRRIESDIWAAKANIDQRTADLREKNRAIAATFPEWTASNRAGTQTAKEENTGKLAAETATREMVATRDAVVLQEMGERLSQFARDSTDPAVLRDLIRDTGAVDPALPALPEDSIPADGPVLSGLTQRERIYPPEASAEQRRIAREERKGAALSDTSRSAVHGRLSTTAKRFTAGGTADGEVVATALRGDAASLRFYERGVIPQASVTVVGADGSLQSRAYTGGPLPVDSIVERIERFDIQRLILGQQQALARVALAGDAVDKRPRQSMLTFSERLSGSAGQAFYSGRILDGEALLEVAQVAADLVTAWTPGVSWGRDVYEAVTGENLITGEQLDGFSRTVAVIGAVTGSLGSKGVRGYEMVSRAVTHMNPAFRQMFKEFGELTVRAWEKVRTIRPELADFGTSHGVESLLKLHIVAAGPKFGANIAEVSKEQIRNVIATGQPYLDIADTVDAGTRARTGLVYVARPERIGIQLAEPEKLPMLLVAVETVGAGDKIRTTYWLEKAYSLEQVEAMLVRGNGPERFRRLPRRGN
jgi:hypothetical protein